ncbi:NAD-dependent epimerase/dehydratase family protein [Flavobacterium sp. AC]|uniref:NAD-dependent epimerase/dehydratase family protein n=1 Tax=Flavobacterium azizsancarii TaxID=2961580 RepID=A0ABT4WH20_9FLAO|nr:NAD-dependent epimerase/dehydratase family protein [Flavobacterium azizsancarii]MDA6071507.1 NAD-dependent epimerase/dehydratase family protein [Flavobacterium azizsancarii]
MQTILGANGIIGEELAKVLRLNYTNKIKLVGRNPKKVHEEDILFKCDLLDPQSVNAALADTDIAYLTVGLPYESELWLRQWPVIMTNVILGCKEHGCKLVYFDNTYAYPQGSKIQNENTPLEPGGKKGMAKKIAAELLLDAIEKKEINAVICRAPEFYGPGKTKGITNDLVFGNLQKHKKPKFLLNDNVKRTLIFTPDASRAMAQIGNTDNAYSQTWHLPCDDDRLTFKEFMEEISKQLGRKISYGKLGAFILKIAAVFNPFVKETLELLPRYAIDNIFDSSKFKKRFPDFRVTTYQEGIKIILKDYKIE